MTARRLSPIGADDRDVLPTEPFEAPEVWRDNAGSPRAGRSPSTSRTIGSLLRSFPRRNSIGPAWWPASWRWRPESLDEYRTRIDANAKQKWPAPAASWLTNRLIKDGRGERLETIWEFHPDAGGFWREVSVRMIANRQLYTSSSTSRIGPTPRFVQHFDALVIATTFSPPNTGADLLAKISNRWIQREYKFALDLPAGWRPALAPSEVALLFANGPSHGVWSDNLLVLAHPRGQTDLEELAQALARTAQQEDPNCEILSCKVVSQGKGQALETVVRTSRGPFSMTVLERRFRGTRFDYEVKYTVESKRFDELAPNFRKSLESFREVPGPAAGRVRRRELGFAPVNLEPSG